MTTRTCIAMAVAFAASLLPVAPARADLSGTSMTITITHTGPAGGIVGPAVINHTYGTPSLFTNMFFGSFTVTHPLIMPAGFDNALLIDFSNFNYSGFAGYTGTISAIGIDDAVAPGSVAILIGGASMGSSLSSTSSSIAGTWNTSDVLGVNAASPQVVVAWNSVPGPGALAVLGLAGLTGRRRRRSA
jgi:MYXO-CTERM domain-containing protein